MTREQERTKRQKATARCSIRLSVPEGRQQDQPVGERVRVAVVAALADALVSTYQRNSTQKEQAA
jgi:hypothetical protein